MSDSHQLQGKVQKSCSMVEATHGFHQVYLNVIVPGGEKVEGKTNQDFILMNKNVCIYTPNNMQRPYLM